MNFRGIKSWVLLSAALVSNLAFAGGREFDGGNGTVVRILLAQDFAQKILQKDTGLPASARETMLAATLRAPKFSYAPGSVTVRDESGRDVPVSARAESANPAGAIEFNVGLITEQDLNLVEVTMLYVHEAGHFAGLSNCMVKSRADLTNDIGFRLVNAELRKPDSVFMDYQRVTAALQKIGAEIDRTSHDTREIRLEIASVVQYCSSAASLQGLVRVTTPARQPVSVTIAYLVEGGFDTWTEQPASPQILAGEQVWTFQTPGRTSLLFNPVRVAIKAVYADGRVSWDNNFGTDYHVRMGR